MDETLYKKDSKGKIRSLNINTNEGVLNQISGLLEGKKTTSSKVCKPKNVGKVNETTKEVQAVQQGEALVIKKLKEGYFRTIEEAKESEVILPMLAKEYSKEQKKIDWSEPVYIQPKLDGMRALGVKENKLISRTGRDIETLNHLFEDIEKLRALGVNIPDGEVYQHGKTFQENMKLIKKYRKDETEQVKYYLYDCISNENFAVRYDRLLLAFHSMRFKTLELVPTYNIKNERELKEYHKRFLSEGYEGSIIRHGEAPYKIDGRSSNLLKYKDFKDMSAIVIDVVPSEARPEQGVIVCKGFRANLKFSHKEREEILLNKEKYIGQTAEIRYFEETDEGLPRFPVCVGFRLDK